MLASSIQGKEQLYGSGGIYHTTGMEVPQPGIAEEPSFQGFFFEPQEVDQLRLLSPTVFQLAVEIR